MNYLAAFFIRVLKIRRRRSVKFFGASEEGFKGHILSAAPMLLIQAFIKSDSINPCCKARLEAEIRQAPIDFYEDDLQNVFRRKLVTYRVKDKIVDTVAVAVINSLECGAVSTLRVHDKLALLRV